jgi:hypothetical protein
MGFMAVCQETGALHAEAGTCMNTPNEQGHRLDQADRGHAEGCSCRAAVTADTMHADS